MEDLKLKLKELHENYPDIASLETQFDEKKKQYEESCCQLMKTLCEKIKKGDSVIIQQEPKKANSSINIGVVLLEYKVLF
jgi:hypothetical protein